MQLSWFGASSRCQLVERSVNSRPGRLHREANLTAMVLCRRPCAVAVALALSASMQSYGVTTDFICKPDFTNPSLTVDCHGRRLADSMARATAAGADCDVVVDISNLKLRKDWTRLTDADWLAVAQGRSPCGFELSTPTGAPSPLPLMRYEESFLEDIRRVEEEDRRL